MRKTRLESSPRLEYVSNKIESTLSSARDADKVLTEMIKNRIKEFLQRSLEKNDHTKLGGKIVNLALLGISAISPDGFGKKLGEASMEIMEEQKISNDILAQKFDRAINKLDSIPTSRLIYIMKIHKTYELENVLDRINTEPIQATVLRKRNSTFT